MLVSGPSSADSFTLNPDGTFDYLPAANFNGTDSFTYKASDGTDESNVATVSITVNAVNDAPTNTVRAPGPPTRNGHDVSAGGGAQISVADVDVAETQVAS